MLKIKRIAKMVILGVAFIFGIRMIVAAFNAEIKEVVI